MYYSIVLNIVKVLECQQLLVIGLWTDFWTFNASVSWFVRQGLQLYQHHGVVMRMKCCNTCNLWLGKGSIPTSCYSTSLSPSSFSSWLLSPALQISKTFTLTGFNMSALGHICFSPLCSQHCSVWGARCKYMAATLSSSLFEKQMDI